MRSEHHWLTPEFRNRNEISQRVEADFGVEMWGRSDRVARRNYGVPVRGTPGHELNADGAAGAGAILHDHGLARRARSNVLVLMATPALIRCPPIERVDKREMIGTIQWPWHSFIFNCRHILALRIVCAAIPMLVEWFVFQGRNIMARHHCLLAALGLSIATVSAIAQTNWPSKPIRIVVPFAPGGTADISARILAERLTKSFSQTFFAENRAGASGNIGAAEVARSTPDGYTFLLGNTPTLAINQFIFPKMPYNTEKDFAPVSFVVRVPNVLVVHPSLGVRSLQELIERAKAKPGSINYGTSGAGTVLHLSAELLKTMAKIDLVHVPYKGSGPMLQDLLAGQVQTSIDNVPSALPHIRSGQLLALAVTPSKPVAMLPNVPTIASVIPGYEAVAFFALMAPTGTPQSI